MSSNSDITISLDTVLESMAVTTRMAVLTRDTAVLSAIEEAQRIVMIASKHIARVNEVVVEDPDESRKILMGYNELVRSVASVIAGDVAAKSEGSAIASMKAMFIFAYMMGRRSVSVESSDESAVG